MAFNAFALPVFASGVVALLMVAMAWPRRFSPAGRAFIALAISLAIWCFPYGLSIMSTTPAGFVMWWRVKYIGIVGVSVAFLLTALAYDGRTWWLRPLPLASLLALPLLTLVLVWTNAAHGLIHASITFTRDGATVIPHIVYGAWFWVHTATAYVHLLVGAALFALAAHRALDVYRMQALALLLAAVAPWAGNTLYLLRIGPFARLDATPIGVTISGLCIAWAILRFRLFDVVPVARAYVIEAMRDGMLVLDAGQRIVDLNARAMAILGQADRSAIGMPAAHLLPLGDGPGLPAEITIGDGAAAQTYELSVSALADASRRASGHVVLLSDVTERRRAQAQREELILQLQQALADVRTLSGLLPICAWCSSVRDDRGYWEELESYVSRHSAAQFSHGICPDCAQKLEHEELRRAIDAV